MPMSSVLIVDDEPRGRELLERWLSPAGYDTRQPPDAETALDLLTASASDVVLCDVQMPGRGGLWLVARLRERFPDVAIVLATVLDIVPPSVSRQDGVVDYLVKPFERDRVLAAVGRAVEWRRAARAKEPRRTAAGDPFGGPTSGRVG
jgi:phosphoserine phosphatase RsbU/P